MRAARGRYTNASLEKGLTILRTVAMASEPIGISETARRASLDYSTTYRLMATLTEMTFLEKSDDKTFRVGPAALPIGLAYKGTADLVTIARPEMQRLMQGVLETVNLSLREGIEMLLLATAAGPHMLSSRTHIGQRFPIHCSASGRVMLATLPEQEREQLIDRLDLAPITPHTITDAETLKRHVRAIAEAGYAVNREEHALGLMAVSVPIRNRLGEVVAALDIAVPTVRVSGDALLETLVRSLSETAERIGERLSAE